MRILDERITRKELRNANYIMGEEMVKGVVDIEKKLLAIDAELHADLEKMLLENGSNQSNLWGINLYFDGEMIEFDSMINIRPSQGNRSRDVENPETREKITEIVQQWIGDDNE